MPDMTPAREARRKLAAEWRAACDSATLEDLAEYEEIPLLLAALEASDAELAACDEELAEFALLAANEDLWLTECEQTVETLRDLRERAAKEPLNVDISDYSDEFCAGFLAGQENALDVLAETEASDG